MTPFRKYIHLLVVGWLAAIAGAQTRPVEIQLSRSNDLHFIAYGDTRFTDPATGYIRRQIAPVHGSDLPLDLVHVALPAGASVTFSASSYAFIRQVILVLEGRLTFIEGDVAHELEPDDCLELGPPAGCSFRNRTSSVCKYLVAVVRR